MGDRRRWHPPSNQPERRLTIPDIKRQPAKGVKAPSSNGSVLGRATPVEDLDYEWQKVVLYGVNRIGKSVLACQFPKPLLLISFEPGTTGGSRSVRKIPGVEFLQIASKGDAVALARELRDPDARTPKGTRSRDIKTHVLDTTTSLQDVIGKELMGLEELPVQMNWGSVSQDVYRERSEQAKEVMRLYRDLPAHTVFVAQEKDHNPPKTVDDKGRERTIGKLEQSYKPYQAESFFAADMGAGTVKWMHDACDFIVRLYAAPETKVVTETNAVSKKVTKRTVETGRMVRRLRTILSTNFAAGFRSENPGAVPEWIEAATPEEMYQKMQAVIRGEPIE